MRPGREPALAPIQGARAGAVLTDGQGKGGVVVIYMRAGRGCVGSCGDCR